MNAFVPPKRTTPATATANELSPKIVLSDTSNASKMIVKSTELCNALDIQPFWMVLAHELIHLYHFLDNEGLYRQLITQLPFTRALSSYWAVWFSKSIYDGLRIEDLWTNAEELLTVLGPELPIPQSAQGEDVVVSIPVVTYSKPYSELALSIGHDFFRFGYGSQRTVIHPETLRDIRNAGLFAQKIILTP